MIAVIALVILAVAVMVGILVVWISKKKREESKSATNYHTFFVIGVVFVSFSTVLMVVSLIFQIPFYVHLPLFALGLVYLIIGLTNKDKWKKK
ncbi:hypothetical protein ACFLXP_00235 [Chloroflexota bacterium]